MVILIESGSTHNFLDKALWKLLKLPISTQDCFEVKVANGDVLGTKGACMKFKLGYKGLFSRWTLMFCPWGDVMWS